MITPALFQKKPLRVSTSSSRNSSAKRPTKLWSRCFRKCKATHRSQITRNGSRKRGASDKKSSATARFFSFSQRPQNVHPSRLWIGRRAAGHHCFDITEYQIKPHFRNNDYEGGLAAGIDLIFKAIRGEYKGSGQTDREKRRGASSPFGFLCFCSFSSFFSSPRAVERRPRLQVFQRRRPDSLANGRAAEAAGRLAAVAVVSVDSAAEVAVSVAAARLKLVTTCEQRNF